MSDTDNKTAEMAGALQEEEIKAGLAKASKSLRQDSDPRFFAWDRQSCFDCADELPEVRIKNGRVRCVMCQTTAEKTGKA